MKINDKDMNVEDLVSNISFDMHKSYNGIMLTDKEYNILKQYGFDAIKYSNVSSLIFDIETMLNEETDIEELEEILKNLSEYNYYHNTNK